MAFNVGKQKGIRPSMNVTPLVDVVLVLLIIFMVVTPLMTKQMSLDVPGKPDEKIETPPPPGALPRPPHTLHGRPPADDQADVPGRARQAGREDRDAAASGRAASAGAHAH